MGQDYSEIIRLATEEVMRRLGGGSTGAPAKTVVIAPSFVPNADKILALVGKDYPGYELVSSGTAETSIGQAAAAYTSAGEGAVTEKIRRCKNIVAVTPKLYQLINIMNGKDAGFTERMIRMARACSKNVTIIMDIVPSLLRENAYYDRIDQVFSALRGMGFTIIERVGAESKEKQPQAVPRMDGLVTGDDIRKLRDAGNKKIQITAGTIVTPLAWDAAKELGVSIDGIRKDTNGFQQ